MMLSWAWSLSQEIFEAQSTEVNRSGLLKLDFSKPFTLYGFNHGPPKSSMVNFMSFQKKLAPTGGSKKYLEH